METTIPQLGWLTDPEVFAVNRKQAHSDHSYCPIAATNWSRLCTSMNFLNLTTPGCGSWVARWVSAAMTAGVPLSSGNTGWMQMQAEPWPSPSEKLRRDKDEKQNA